NRLTRPNALAVNFGPLLPANLPPNVTLALSDLDWNPVLPSNFVPGKKGSLIAEDQTQDILYVVDPRNRFPQTNLYSVYGTHTTAATSFSVSAISTSPPRPMTPFAGNVGPFLYVNAITGVVVPNATLTTPSGTGSFLLGARAPSSLPPQLLGPRRIRKGPSQTFGALPKNTKFVNA